MVCSFKQTEGEKDNYSRLKNKTVKIIDEQINVLPVYWSYAQATGTNRFCFSSNKLPVGQLVINKTTQRRKRFSKSKMLIK